MCQYTFFLTESSIYIIHIYMNISQKTFSLELNLIMINHDQNKLYLWAVTNV